MSSSGLHDDTTWRDMAFKALGTYYKNEADACYAMAYTPGLGGLGQALQSPPAPAIKRPETESKVHTTHRPDLNAVGQRMIAALDNALPIKLRLPIATYEFRTSRHNESGALSNPRIVVKLHGGKEIEFPIDDEKTWPTDDVIGRIALEAP